MSDLKVSVIGYGKMGELIHNTAIQNGIEIVSMVDPRIEDMFNSISELSIGHADVCIDFTTPESVLNNVRKLSSLGKNIVVGTTGWENNHLSEVRRIVESSDVGLIYSSNFSVGANIYFAVIERLLKISSEKEYELSGIEMHHKEKKDKPSGTARTLEKMIKEITGRNLEFQSIREGGIKGVHTLRFDSEYDFIEVTHSAKNRSGFAYGALIAAEFIKDKKGFYGPDDFRRYLLDERK